ncbi:ABC transporter substrate-binding protein [Cognatishimia maritima]|uniref:NitT/TauT family transport system ATP-binding protein n=1 Tax=Cognatishimia maritima TaxID=870908 RepID=A0A1M5PMC2_9RHOB|nr:ABC transporter substrate-binding protein [Cognatishimia maritima]SHH02938.1 NitT/TauT family transport system ATP-binding protein [Cognatishimia maritima]
MSLQLVKAGYIPLVDAAPLIVAKELGFAEEEGLSLALEAAPSWSTLRDLLAFGQIQAAHMLSPVPVASALGLLAGLPRLNALMVTSANGNVFGLSSDMTKRLLDAGFGFDLHDAKVAGQAIATLPRPLRIGVPFALSMHAELVTMWLTHLGLTTGQDFHIQAVPPPLMTAAIERRELDGFCVGEPWGSITVERAAGSLVLPTAAIWSSAPEKVLAVRESWAEENDETVSGLMRAVWRACCWLSDEKNLTMAAEVLSTGAYLGINSEVIDRALSGRFIINSTGDMRRVENFLRFEGNGVCFPWLSQGRWIAERLSQRYGLPETADLAAASQVFRTDLYRKHLFPIGAEMPLRSSKIEGALTQPTEVSTVSGSMILGRDRFFNDEIFDPSAE